MPEQADRRAEIEPSRRWVAVGWIAVAVCVVGAVVGWIVLQASDTTWHMIDLGVYRWGGETVLSAEDRLYTSQWDGSAISGYHGDPLLFTYTPFAALVFSAFTITGVTVSQVLWLTVGIVALGYVVHLGVRAMGYRSSRATVGLTAVITVGALALEPVSQTLFFGQVNLVLMALVVADLSRVRGRAAGVLTGLATGIKLTPGLFVVFLFAARRFRAGVTAALTAAATVVIGFILAPSASGDFWGDRLFLDGSRVGDVDFLSNQSLAGAWARATDSTGRSIVPLAIGILVVLAALWCGTRLAAAGRGYWAVSTVALGGLLVSPISWTHHWVWVVPALLSVVGAVRQDVLPRGALVPVGLAVVVFLSVPLVPGTLWFVGEPSLGGPVEPILSNLYLLMALVVLGTLGAAATRAESSGAESAAGTRLAERLDG